MRIKILTHSDLDGISSELSVKQFYGKDVHYDVSRCNYNNINGALYGVLKEEINDFDKVYITDISINPKMAEWVDKSFRDKVVLIDHHISEATDHLKKYSWVTLKGEDENGVKISAGKLVAQYFEVLGKNKVFDHITEAINLYDTWLWKEQNYTFSNELNKIAYMIGFDKLLEEFEYQIDLAEHNLNITEFAFRSEWQFLLAIESQKYQRYLESCSKALQIRNYKQYTFGYVFAEQFISELGNDLAVLNPYLDFIAIINLKTGVSLRSTRDDLLLGDLAKEIADRLGCSGGGHKYKASGISLTRDFKDVFVDSIFHANGFDTETKDKDFYVGRF